MRRRGGGSGKLPQQDDSLVLHPPKDLTLQYDDPDSHVSGITSFKLEDKAMLESVLQTIAQKANMTLRGDVYVKKRDVSTKLDQ